jgi:hypothetical protein
METSEATIRPTNRPKIAATNAEPGNDDTKSALIRQGLRVKYGAIRPPNKMPARVRTKPQGRNSSLLDDKSEI